MHEPSRTPSPPPTKSAYADGEGEGGGEGSLGLTDFARRNFALRLGFRQAKGVKETEIAKLVAARGEGYRSAERLWGRGGLDAATLARLAEADAFRSLGMDRRQALWAVRGLGEAPLPLFAAQPVTTQPGVPTPDDAAAADGIADGAGLPVMPLSQHVIEDYRALSLSLKRHPLAFLRPRLMRRGFVASDRLALCRNGQKISVAGLVLVRQRPGTASGVIFMTLEDETGIANLVVWSRLFESSRRAVMTAKLMGCQGKLQIEGKPPHQVIHVVAERLTDLTPLLASLREDGPEHDSLPSLLEVPLARADEVARPNDRGDPRVPALEIRSRDFH